MAVTIAQIYRYPVKGLSAQPLTQTELTAGEGVKGDRSFALALASTRFDPREPQWLPKTNFLMLMRNARLASLETAFDDSEGTLSLSRGGKEVARGKITTPVGRALIEDFFKAYMEGEIAGKPKLVEAPFGHMFSDHKNKVLSVINLNTIQDLERVTGQPIDPLRFRANLYVDGAPPWSEFNWISQDIAIGGAQLRITERIDRCAATTVNPATGKRDMNIPKALQRGFGHIDCGVFAHVSVGGPIAIADVLEIPRHAD